MIDPAAWAALPRVELGRDVDLVVAVDATVDHTSAAVVAAGRVGDVIALEVVEHLPGVGWVGPFLVDLAKKLAGTGRRRRVRAVERGRR